MTFRWKLLGSAALISLGSAALAQQGQTTPQQPSPATATTQPTAAGPATSPPSPPADTSAAQATDEDYGDEAPIVIQGSRARGSVVGDIPPQNILDSRDVRATGATSISDLLDALAPQIGSAQGRGGEQPVLLLNGQRIS
ncbi:MAG TPA: hypothetical protein VLM36_13100, partial [Sphingomicrobium sp.]|nr:hypothetical protein [Sphingomicrobium sp.]